MTINHARLILIAVESQGRWRHLHVHLRHRTSRLLSVLLCCCCLALLAGGCASSEKPAENLPRTPRRVLIIGNSDIADHGGLANALTRLSHGMLDCTACTAPGRTLAWHWTRGQALATLHSEHWDDVVLQDDSAQILRRSDIFALFVRRFAGQIQSAGGNPVLMTSWPPHDSAGEGTAIARVCEDAAARSDAVLAPVQSAWQRARQDRPDLALYADDGTSASEAGAYLTACVLYKILLNRTPVGLQSFVVDPQGSPLITLAPADAQFLQQVAEKTVEAERSPSDPDIEKLFNP